MPEFGSEELMMIAKIMIVEDNNPGYSPSSFEVQLRTAKYRTVWAEDTNGAIDLCAEEMPDPNPPGSCSLVGGDGFMVMEAAPAAKCSHSTIIVLSARDPELNEALALQLGAVAFMEKPWRMSELLAAIRKFAALRTTITCVKPVPYKCFGSIFWSDSRTTVTTVQSLPPASIGTAETPPPITWRRDRDLPA